MKTVLFVILSALAVAGKQVKADEKPVLVVAQIQVSPDLQVPSEWLANFTSRLIELVKSSPKYGQVIAPGDTAAVPQQAETLHVTLVGFEKSSRASRYSVGYGAGQEKLEATVALVGPTGAVLFSKDFSSTMTWGPFFGGKSGKTPRKLAEKIVHTLP